MSFIKQFKSTWNKRKFLRLVTLELESQVGCIALWDTPVCAVCCCRPSSYIHLVYILDIICILCTVHYYCYYTITTSSMYMSVSSKKVFVFTHAGHWRALLKYSIIAEPNDITGLSGVGNFLECSVFIVLSASILATCWYR